MLFDPVKEKKTALEFTLNFELSQKFDAKRPMGNVASSCLGSIVHMWLCGLQKEISPLLPKLGEWLDYAIDKGDEFGPNNEYHMQLLHISRALWEWMDSDCDSPSDWRNAAANIEGHWRNANPPIPRNEVISGYLDDYMGYAFQAEPDEGVAGYEIAIDMYEYWIGEKPFSIKKTLKPREYAYALCLHHARQQFSEEEIFEAGKNLLNKYLLEEWLNHGQYLRAAMWLKIVYWQSNQSLTAIETILKAYDHMPNVKRPNFLNDSASINFDLQTRAVIDAAIKLKDKLEKSKDPLAKEWLDGSFGELLNHLIEGNKKNINDIPHFNFFSHGGFAEVEDEYFELHSLVCFGKPAKTSA